MRFTHIATMGFYWFVPGGTFIVCKNIRRTYTADGLSIFIYLMAIKVYRYNAKLPDLWDYLINYCLTLVDNLLYFISRLDPYSSPIES